jgi:hypothetical protein
MRNMHLHFVMYYKTDIPSKYTVLISLEAQDFQLQNHHAITGGD